jgi:hypothetical protein
VIPGDQRLAVIAEQRLAVPVEDRGDRDDVDPRLSATICRGSSGGLNWNSPIFSAMCTGSSTLPSASSRPRK